MKQMFGLRASVNNLQAIAKPLGILLQDGKIGS